MNIFMQWFNVLGGYGEILVFFLSNYLLWNHSKSYFYYNIGWFINFLLNIILKGFLQQPRPKEDPRNFELLLKHGKRFVFKNGMPYDLFGMPSAHAQSCFYSTIFIYLTFKQMNLLFLYLIISMGIVSQRVVFDHHTILQVIVGSILGAIFGYIVYYFTQEKIKGNIQEKPDDDAPI